MQLKADIPYHMMCSSYLSVKIHTGKFQVVFVQVAILCNHQRAVPKGHAGQMEKLSDRMHKLNEELLELQHELKAAQKGKAYGDKKKRDPERYIIIFACLEF